MGLHHQRGPQRGCRVDGSEMNVMHKGKEYRVIKLACGYEWKFVSVNNQRDTFSMNYTQMVNAGFANITGAKQ